jgi:hypothetical protein
MLYRHPIMTLQHMIDGRREEPIRPQRAQSAPTTTAKGTKT